MLLGPEVDASTKRSALLKASKNHEIAGRIGIHIRNAGEAAEITAFSKKKSLAFRSRLQSIGARQEPERPIIARKCLSKPTIIQPPPSNPASSSEWLLISDSGILQLFSGAGWTSARIAAIRSGSRKSKFTQPVRAQLRNLSRTAVPDSESP